MTLIQKGFPWFGNHLLMFQINDSQFFVCLYLNCLSPSVAVIKTLI